MKAWCQVKCKTKPIITVFQSALLERATQGTSVSVRSKIDLCNEICQNKLNLNDSMELIKMVSGKSQWKHQIIINSLSFFAVPCFIEQHKNGSGDSGNGMGSGLLMAWQVVPLQWSDTASIILVVGFEMGEESTVTCCEGGKEFFTQPLYAIFRIKMTFVNKYTSSYINDNFVYQ